MERKLFKFNKCIVVVLLLWLLLLGVEMLIEPVSIVSRFSSLFIMITLIIFILFFFTPIIRIGLFLMKTNNETRIKKLILFLCSFVIISLLHSSNIFFINSDFPIVEGIIGGLIIGFSDMLFFNSDNSY